MHNRLILPLLCAASVAFAAAPFSHSEKPIASAKHHSEALSAPIVTTFDITRPKDDAEKLRFSLHVTNNTPKMLELRFPDGQTNRFPGELESEGSARSLHRRRGAPEQQLPCRDFGSVRTAVVLQETGKSKSAQSGAFFLRPRGWCACGASYDSRLDPRMITLQLRREIILDQNSCASRNISVENDLRRDRSNYQLISRRLVAGFAVSPQHKHAVQLVVRRTIRRSSGRTSWRHQRYTS